MWTKLTSDKNYQLAACIALLILISAILNMVMIPEKHNTASNSEPSASVDTFIPKGFVLIPIEIINKEAVNGLIEGKGIVDLYDQKKNAIARQVRLVQAPLNNKIFAVLVPDAEAPPILQHTQGVYVVIQSANANGKSQVVVNSSAVTKTKINYGDAP